MSNQNKWNLLYFITKNYDKIDDIFFQLLLLSIHTFKANLNIDKIYIYSNSNEKLKKYSKEHGFKFKSKKNNRGEKFSYIVDFLEKKINVAVANDRLCMTNDFRNVESMPCSLYLEQKDLHDEYIELAEKYTFSKYINSDAMIITSNNSTKKIFKNAHLLATRLNISKSIVNDNIAITIAIRKDTFVNIENIFIVSYIEDNVFYDSIVEIKRLIEKSASKYDRNNNINWKNLISMGKKYFSKNDFRSIVSFELMIPSIPYYNNEFYYYPFMDIISTKTKLKLPVEIFNTNQSECHIEDKMQYSKLYKRFTEKRSGLFIKKKTYQTCPLNIHIINGNEIISYVSENFNIKIWTQDMIDNMVNNSRWANYYSIDRNVISKLAIIDLYGGLVVNGNWNLLDVDIFNVDLGFVFVDEINGLDIRNDIMIGKASLAVDNIWNNLHTQNITQSILTAFEITIFPSYYFHYYNFLAGTIIKPFMYKLPFTS